MQLLVAEEKIREMWSILVSMAITNTKEYESRVPLVYQLLCQWHQLHALCARRESETNVYWEEMVYHS